MLPLLKLSQLKALITAWRHRTFDDPPPPAPDPAWPERLDGVTGVVVDVVAGDGWHRIVIVRDNAGLYRLQVQAWAPDWEMRREAAWFGHGHVGSLCDSLERARTMAVETLALRGERVIGARRDGESPRR